MAAVTCFYTSVINRSNFERAFGFLGKHGMRLLPAEQVTVPGNLIDQLAKSPRKFAALERAVNDGSLAIIKTPSVHVYDSTVKRTRAVGIDNGALQVADPCWGTYLGALTGTFTAIPDGSVAIATATVAFSAELAAPITVANIKLTRGGSPVTLTGVTVTTTDNITFTISDLTSLTGTNGAYIISVDHTSGTIADVFGNVLATDPSEGWTKS